VEGYGAAPRGPPEQVGFLQSLYRRLCKRVALRHVRGVAPEACNEGRFDNLDEDVAEGAAHCFRFLVSTGLGTSDSSSSALGPPLVEEELGSRLRDALETFKSAGCSWKWEVFDVTKSKVERVFVIIGASRSGAIRRGPVDILVAFGQQFVLTPDQTQRFVDSNSGITGRMAVLQELICSDAVLVADAALTVQQRTALMCPGSADSAEPEWRQHYFTTQHILRLEMSLTQQNKCSDDSDTPYLSASPWQIVDWNWVCHGNHPSLPTGKVAAPW